MLDALIKAAPRPVRRHLRRAKSYAPVIGLMRDDPRIAVDLGRGLVAAALVELAGRIRPAEAA